MHLPMPSERRTKSADIKRHDEHGRYLGNEIAPVNQIKEDSLHFSYQNSSLRQIQYKCQAAGASADVNSRYGVRSEGIQDSNPLSWEDDPTNPLNWSNAAKTANVGLICGISLVVPLASCRSCHYSPDFMH